MTKHSSCKYKYKFDVEKCNLNQKWNKDKCFYEHKNLTEHNACEKDYIWNPAACSCQNGEYVGSIIDHSVITCDEIIEATKRTLTNLSILLTFSLITIALLIAISIFYYQIKHRSKQKELLSHHHTSNKLKEIDINDVIYKWVINSKI